MTEQTFEEQFPNLKGKDCNARIKWFIGEKEIDEPPEIQKLYQDKRIINPIQYEHSNKNEIVFVSDIIKYCLDKQKVRDAIVKWLEQYEEAAPSHTLRKTIIAFKRELGL